MKILSAPLLALGLIAGLSFAAPAQAQVAKCVVNLVIKNPQGAGKGPHITAVTRTKTRANLRWNEKRVRWPDRIVQIIRAGETYRGLLEMDGVGCNVARQGELLITCHSMLTASRTERSGTSVIKFWGGGYAQPRDIEVTSPC